MSENDSFTVFQRVTWGKCAVGELKEGSHQSTSESMWRFPEIAGASECNGATGTV